MAQEEITQGPSTLDLVFSLTKGAEITFDTRLGVNVSHASFPEVHTNVRERKVVVVIDSMEAADDPREEWNLRGHVVALEGDTVTEYVSCEFNSRTRNGLLHTREA